MRFETEWPGDNVATPVCDTLDWEDAFLDGLGGAGTRSTLAGTGVLTAGSLNRICAEGSARHSDELRQPDFAGLAPMGHLDRCDRYRVVVESAPRTRDPPYPSGLEDDRRPNPEGYRNFPLSRSSMRETHGHDATVVANLYGACRKFQPAGGAVAGRFF